MPAQLNIPSQERLHYAPTNLDKPAFGNWKVILSCSLSRDALGLSEEVGSLMVQHMLCMEKVSPDCFGVCEKSVLGNLPLAGL